MLVAFVPAPTDTFDILVAGTRSGTFSSVNVTSDLMPAGTFDVVYTLTTVRLTNFQPTGLPGDYNHNNVVDAADYVVWRKAGGSQEGFDIWRSHFGQTSVGSGAAGNSSASIPEPASITLLCIAWLCVMLADRRVEGANNIDAGKKVSKTHRLARRPISVLGTENRFQNAGGRGSRRAECLHGGGSAGASPSHKRF